MGEIIDLANQRFGRLVVQRIAKRKRSKTTWLCECDCGALAIVSSDKLRSAHTLSCGCLIEYVSQFVLGRVMHGDTRTTEYHSYKAMIARCEDSKSGSYERYGAVGIKVCRKWRKDFTAFLDDMGRKPSPAHTLDRIDNTKGYYPGNCRWATRKQQQRNRRNTPFVEINGYKISLAELAEQRNFPLPLLYRRIVILKWPVDRALSQSPKEYHARIN